MSFQFSVFGFQFLDLAGLFAALTINNSDGGMYNQLTTNNRKLKTEN